MVAIYIVNLRSSFHPRIPIPLPILPFASFLSSFFPRVVVVEDHLGASQSPKMSVVENYLLNSHAILY